MIFGLWQSKYPRKTPRKRGSNVQHGWVQQDYGAPEEGWWERSSVRKTVVR